ncbi:MAG: hypothetical protein CVV41_06085 [Candidatus Riflebacteria bacterium HGW-Riflebacteria-1]|jgi:hypothetical protein|nr:MAG: hypothetical protein CVV41_06085 [Candidatus Riflebacteria bacterium HGW-Riflebacteria-1]
MKLELREAARITLMSHHGLSGRVVELLTAFGIPSVLVERARCVRQNVSAGFFGFAGLRLGFSDAASEIYRITVARAAASPLLCRLVEGLDLRTPGRGAVYAQDIAEVSFQNLSDVKVEPARSDWLLNDLTLITGIQSKSGGGESLYKVALKLGAGVPVVGLGIGTGIRERLGLIRITISPEKELVFLMVPGHDANGLQRLLIEEGHIDRPGGGFLYQTPIRYGMVDPLLRIGRQEHAASIEQIVAAIDDLKKNTAWRKRFFGVEDISDKGTVSNFTHREISFYCHEGQGDNFVQAAMHAGAAGATMSRVRTLYLQGADAGRHVSCEHGILCVPTRMETPVLQALGDTAEICPEKDWVLQSVPAASVFTHKRS